MEPADKAKLTALNSTVAQLHAQAKALREQSGGIITPEVDRLSREVSSQGLILDRLHARLITEAWDQYHTALAQQGRLQRLIAAQGSNPELEAELARASQQVRELWAERIWILSNPTQ